MRTLNAADILQHKAMDPSIGTKAQDLLTVAACHLLAQKRGVERISVQTADGAVRSLKEKAWKRKR